jgi:general secretion pathway protein K
VSSRAARNGERGVILLAVLLAVAVMSVMVVAATSLTRAGIGSEQLEQRRLATHFALRSGLEAAKALILTTPAGQRAYFYGDPLRLQVGEGQSVTVAIRDAAGLIDLNRSDPELIETLARLSGLDDPAVDGLAARIETLREQAKPKESAPDPAGKQPEPGTPPAQVGGVPVPPAPTGEPQPKAPAQPLIFLAVDQIGELVSLESATAQAFTAGLTVFSPSDKINPLAAPREVLAIVPGITPNDLAVFADVRKNRKPPDDPRLQQIIERLKQYLSVAEPTVFIIDVEIEDGADLLPGSRSRAAVQISEAALPFHTLAVWGE